MRSGAISRVLWGAFLTIILALPNKPSAAANCALYVRAETGVTLYGAAGGWWRQAEGLYGRGHLPAVGAILVFSPTRHMRSGHVALVAKIVSEREILVDHANWYHGTVSRGMPVVDTSPANDWTSVAVLEVRSGKYGRDNPSFGFIYPAPTAPQPEFIQAAATTDYADPDTPVTRPMRPRKAHRNR
jgi:CHAP domain